MKNRIHLWYAVSLISAWLLSPLRANAIPLVTDGTLGFYNSGVGSVLNGTDPFFTGDPGLSVSTAPNLAAAATQLGGWLQNPPDLTTAGSTWSAAPVSIPTSWNGGTETAVVYTIGSAGTQLTNVVESIGVDNGILAWLDGSFIHGDTGPGVATPGEYVYNLGDLSPGVHYLQFLRVGQGGSENWSIQVTGTPVTVVPEATSLLLLGAGLAGAWACRRLGRARHRIPGSSARAL